MQALRLNRAVLFFGMISVAVAIGGGALYAKEQNYRRTVTSLADANPGTCGPMRTVVAKGLAPFKARRCDAFFVHPVKHEFYLLYRITENGKPGIVRTYQDADTWQMEWNATLSDDCLRGICTPIHKGDASYRLLEEHHRTAFSNMLGPPKPLSL